jgi:hypothetical protein
MLQVGATEIKMDGWMDGWMDGVLILNNEILE